MILGIFSCVYLLCVYLKWWNIYSSPLPKFQLCHYYFCCWVMWVISVLQILNFIKYMICIYFLFLLRWLCTFLVGLLQKNFLKILNSPMYSLLLVLLVSNIRNHCLNKLYTFQNSITDKNSSKQIIKNIYLWWLTMCQALL